MSEQAKLEIVRRLESLVSLQRDCLDGGNWEDYDKIETEIKRLEQVIVSF